MPKNAKLVMNFSQSIEYDEDDEGEDDPDEDISDDDYQIEQTIDFNRNLASLSQIVIVCRLLGKREFVLGRRGTKTFYNKVRQYQELSQIDKPGDINYASRMGKGAEILCKLAALSEVLLKALEILQ